MTESHMTVVVGCAPSLEGDNTPPLIREYPTRSFLAPRHTAPNWMNNIYRPRLCYLYFCVWSIIGLDSFPISGRKSILLQQNSSMPCNPCCCDSDDFTLNDTRSSNLWANILLSCVLCPVVAYTYIESEIEKRRSGTSPLPPVVSSPAPRLRATYTDSVDKTSKVAGSASCGA